MKRSRTEKVIEQFPQCSLAVVCCTLQECQQSTVNGTRLLRSQAAQILVWCVGWPLSRANGTFKALWCGNGLWPFWVILAILGHFHFHGRTGRHLVYFSPPPRIGAYRGIYMYLGELSSHAHHKKDGPPTKQKHKKCEASRSQNGHPTRRPGSRCLALHFCQKLSRRCPCGCRQGRAVYSISSVFLLHVPIELTECTSAPLQVLYTCFEPEASATTACEAYTAV
jgi:hypothetical protein